MTARDLHTLLAQAADDAQPDAELLAAGDLAALVRRHGPLVWSTCRRMLPDPADAADAFQAVFLALSKSAKRIYRPAAVGGWLHAAAVRVCLKQRRTAARRRLREKRVARPEAVVPVADAAWDAILAAVHEEIDHLPDGERTAFVLCELQGVPAGEAAVRLGWKSGTLTGRLSKARGRLLTRLNARGYAPAVGLTVASTLTVPAEVMARLSPSASVSPTVLALSTEVTAMVTTKHLAAAVLVTAGLLAGVGGGLMSRLDAQDPKPIEPPAAKDSPTPAPGRPGGMGFNPLAVIAGMGATSGEAIPGGVRWEYAYEAKPESKLSFMDLLAKRGRAGWEYAGVASFADPAGMGMMGGGGGMPGAPGGMGGGMGGPPGGGMPGMPGGMMPGGGPSRTESVVVFKRPVGVTPPPRMGSDSRPGAKLFEVPPGSAGEVAKQLPDHVRKVYPTAGEVHVTAVGDRQLLVHASADDLILVEAIFKAGISTGPGAGLRLPMPPPASRPAPPPATVGGFQAISLKYAKASEVAKVLQELFANYRDTINRPKLLASADERRNLILFATAGDKSLEDEVRKLVAELDVPK